MSASIDLSSLLSPHTFTLFIAPSETIQEALNTLMNRQRGKILYLCGNYPEILPKFTTASTNLVVRRALTIYQVQTILAESDERLTLFEHDRSLFDDNADLLPYIGEFCRHKAEDTGSVFIFSTKLDKWLILLEPYVHRMVLILNDTPSVKQTHAVTASTQKNLDGIW
ncbi:MAG: hypothetical protein V1862_02980 [Methanobacteriota archaeon]